MAQTNDSKTFLVYFSVTLSLISLMGLFFIYSEIKVVDEKIIDHRNDVIQHANQTEGLLEVFMAHINATKKGVSILHDVMPVIEQINRSTFK